MRDAAYLARLRLWLTMWLMPRGYALWEYGRYSDDGLDLMLLAKALPEEGFELCRACHATGERSDGRSCSSCEGDGIVRVIA